MKLGRKLGAVQDPRTLRLRDFAALPTPPVRVTTGSGERIRMYGNDRLGDCTCASMAHGVDLHERSAKQVDTQLSTDDVVRVYSAVSGYDPATGVNDNGAYLLDVLRVMRTKGMGLQKNGTPHTISAYAKVDHTNLDEVRAAIYTFGGVYVGAGLPVSAENEFDAQEPWSDLRDDWGSWGGHALWAPGFTSEFVTLTTWGRRQRATWDWFETYVDEVWAVISPDWFDGSKTPRGLNVKALQEALATL